MEKNITLYKAYEAEGIVAEFLSPGEPPFLALILEAFKDAKGIYHEVKIARADGKIDTIEVHNIGITALQLSKKYVPLWSKFAFWLRKVLTKRKQKKA